VLSYFDSSTTTTWGARNVTAVDKLYVTLRHIAFLYDPASCTSLTSIECDVSAEVLGSLSFWG
jgi:hypothetical protein